MASVRRLIAGIVAGLLVGPALIGCGSTAPGPLPSATLDTRLADRDRLAGLAAAAKDKRYVATYTLTTGNRPNRTVTAAFGTDGSWVVAVPGGALGGLADIAIYRSASGLFQCLLGPAPGTAEARPDLGPLTPRCVAVPALTTATDPLVQHIFTDWIDSLVDRATALSVAVHDAVRRKRVVLLGGVELGRARASGRPGRLLLRRRRHPHRCAGGLRHADPGRNGRGRPASVAIPASVVARPPLPTAAPPPPTTATPWVRIPQSRLRRRVGRPMPYGRRTPSPPIMVDSGPAGGTLARPHSRGVTLTRHHVAGAPPSLPRRGPLTAGSSSRC